jgi:hypothetical protein
MPIIKVEEDGTAKYVGVREIEDSSVDHQLHGDKVVSRGRTRGDVENALQVDYLDRLEQHARDCALLEHLVENPPDQNAAEMLGTFVRLAQKVASDAMDLRTYDPFVVLVAEADYSEDVKIGEYAPFATETQRWSLDVCDPESSWRSARWALCDRAPWRIQDKEERERQEEEKRKQDQGKLSPQFKKALKAFGDAVDADRKRDARKRTSKRRAA